MTEKHTIGQNGERRLLVHHRGEAFRLTGTSASGVNRRQPTVYKHAAQLSVSPRHVQPETLRGADLIYFCDSQSVVGDWSNDRSPSPALQDVILCLALKLALVGLRLVLEWRLCNSPGGRLVDWLGKYVDNGAGRLCVLARTLQILADALRLAQFCRIPTIDATASDENFCWRHLR